MSRKTAFSSLSSLLILLGGLLLAFETQPVGGLGTIRIKADGNVEGTGYIQTADNVTYVFVADILASIVVERSDIVIDGNGYALQGGPWGGSGTGIDLSERTNVTVQNAQILRFDVGIGLGSSSSNIISRNSVANNGDGIRLDSSSRNLISGNNVTANDRYGIYLSDSPNNTLVGNAIANNGYNFGVESKTMGLSDYVNYVDVSNLVDGKPVYYWVDKRDMIVPFDAGYLALVNCTGITAQDLDLTRNGEGALLAYTTDSTITQNSVTNNGCNIRLVFSYNNTISDNTITNSEQNAYSLAGYGIALCYASNNVLKNNTMAGNACNFYIYGSSLSDYLNDVDTTNTVEGKPIYYWVNENGKAILSDAGYVALVNCTHITVQNLTLNNDSPDILLAYTTESTLTMNTITPVGSNGIFLWYSPRNAIIENEMMNSIELHYSSNCNITANAFSGSGLFVASSFGSAVKDNTVNGKPLVYLEGVSGNSVTDAGQVILVNCSNISAKNLTLSDTLAGLLLQGTNNSVVTNNTITNNWSGIWLGESANNTIVANNIEHNQMGILIYESSKNTVYHNNFLENSAQINLPMHGYANSWDSGYPSGGNYWSSFNPADENKDKIGDAPYRIDDNNTDRHPLIFPFEWYAAGYKPSPDSKEDGFVNILDLSTVSKAFGCRPGDPHWNLMADMDMNEIINIIDVSMVGKHYGERVLSLFISFSLSKRSILWADRSIKDRFDVRGFR